MNPIKSSRLQSLVSFGWNWTPLDEWLNLWAEKSDFGFSASVITSELLNGETADCGDSMRSIKPEKETIDLKTKLSEQKHKAIES